MDGDGGFSNAAAQHMPTGITYLSGPPDQAWMCGWASPRSVRDRRPSILGQPSQLKPQEQCRRGFLRFFRLFRRMESVSAPILPSPVAPAKCEISELSEIRVMGAGWKTPSVSGDWPPSPGSWQKAGRIEAPGSARSQKTRRLVSWQRWLPHFRSSGAVGVVYAGERYRQFRPPPSLRSATAVLTATRGKGVDRMPPQVADCPRNALQNEGRGVCRLTKDRQPRTCRGANWAPQTARLLAGNATSTATATQARPGRWSFGGVVVYTIGGLLESRSPRRHASADRRWR
jgi:hypothetical protein